MAEDLSGSPEGGLWVQAGGDAHLSRSVLDAGGLDQLGEVLERRVRPSASSFSRFFDSLFFSIALGIMIVGGLCRKWNRAGREPVPARLLYTSPSPRD